VSLSVALTLAISLLGLGVALYAATLSRRALAWQQQRDAERLATRVRVGFEHRTEQIGPFVIVAGDNDPRPYPVEYRLTLVVTNDGETTEYVTWCAAQQAEGDLGYDLSGNLGGDRALKPRERLTVDFAANECGFDLTPGFVGVVRLASGEQVRSDVEHLSNELVAHVAEHNRHARR
jgi:hypothetical protein